MKLARTLSLVVVLAGIAGCSASMETADDGTASAGADVSTAAVSLRIPLLDDKGDVLAKHNAQFRAAGLGTFAATVDIAGGADGSSLPGADKAFSDASTLADKGAEKLHLDIAMREFGEPPDFETRDPSTSICYRGNAKLVVPLIESLADGVFSDQLNVHGWRYKQVKVVEDEGGDESGFPVIWKTWRGDGEAVLTLTASSDEGVETHVGLIPRCAR
jgi:hypothetical protein